MPLRWISCRAARTLPSDQKYDLFVNYPLWFMNWWIFLQFIISFSLISLFICKGSSKSRWNWKDWLRKGFKRSWSSQKNLLYGNITLSSDEVLNSIKKNFYFITNYSFLRIYLKQWAVKSRNLVESTEKSRRPSHTKSDPITIQ